VDVEQIKKRLEEFRYWYHKIELAPGLVTPGFDLDPIWANIRNVRKNLDYKDRRVLDIASFDGLFAFEAEKLGAKSVIATDCLYRSFSNFLFCREVFASKVLPYFNISPYNLSDRLDVYLDENYDDERPNERLFDIVQHFGLLYHLRDPMYSLSQARSVLKAGGILFLETDVVMDVNESYMLYNGLPHHARVRDNYSVWWAPTRECLFEMLEGTLFQVQKETYSEIFFDTPANDQGRISSAVRNTIKKDGKSYRIGRGAVLATACKFGIANEKFERELGRTYRNPGLSFERFTQD
jgi:tRNA (mo5U34)-methyltransferase